ncbi:MAG: hypothetical protein SFU86_09035 [Pirellulaceae bacterium]|nr:hypothetical protein [Pirellulaceae bacterium]
MIALRRQISLRERWSALQWPKIAPLRVLPLLTLVLLLVSGPEQWYLRGPLVALVALGIGLRTWLARPQFWYVVATLLGIAVYLNWESSDNHKYLFVYWCLALCAACSLPQGEQAPALALSSRWLIGLCMALAVVWKAINPQYLDGTFFQYELLCDERLASLTTRLTGLAPAELAANRELRELLQAGHLRGLEVSSAELTTRPAIAWLAAAMTWWTIGIELVLAVLFLWPAGRDVAGPASVAWLRNAALVAFAATTYVVAPVRGFGWMLMLLGLAQCREEENRWRLVYLAMLVVIQAYTLPVSAIANWLF